MKSILPSHFEPENNKQTLPLHQLSNDELIAKTKKAIQVERKATTEVVRLIREISDRKLYLERGFPSLYEMVTKEFGYCAGSAMRRINSMKLIKEIPEVEEKIESGELSLTVASDVQSFLYAEAKERRAYSLNAKIELIQTCLNKSKREVEKEFVRRNPQREKRESVRAISSDRLRVSFSISENLNQKLNHLKNLMSHSNPGLSTEGLIEILAELGLEKFDPVRRAKRIEKRKAKASLRSSSNRDDSRDRAQKTSAPESDEGSMSPELSPPPAEVVRVSQDFLDAETPIAIGFSKTAQTNLNRKTRYINAKERRKLIETYDRRGCSYVDEKTGRRCESKYFLELDHITPFSYGGENTAENLQVMCSRHNRFRWQRRSSYPQDR